MTLSKCPHCGGESEIIRNTDIVTASERYRVTCRKCKCGTGECVTIADAIMKWSARYDENRERAEG